MRRPTLSPKPKRQWAWLINSHRLLPVNDPRYPGSDRIAASQFGVARDLSAFADPAIVANEQLY